jgi:2-desacetyl-2-hydroxyethyl bacteriochlorophyllide A dehydrogenase
MERSILKAVGPNEVRLINEEIEDPGPGEISVKTEISAVSAGTEIKLITGKHTRGKGTYVEFDPVGHRYDFPFPLGYSAVGRIESIGKEVSRDLLGMRVFSLAPHCTIFKGSVEELVPIPDGISSDDAVFLSNMDTALTMVMDGNPIVGEEVLVFGQGVVGIILTSILSMFPLNKLITVDKNPLRREFSKRAGATESIHPDDLEPGISDHNGFDLVYEVTGNPETLFLVHEYAGFAGRVVIGSYYGDVEGKLMLGDSFHRKRLRIMTSQVSSIDPSNIGRWDRNRRTGVSMDLLKRVDPHRFITHRFDIVNADVAYDMLLASPKDHLQIVFDYG